MKLDEHWQEILRRAWSVRLMALAAVLSGIEVILPLFGELFDRGVFAALSFAAVVAAFVARLAAQKDL